MHRDTRSSSHPPPWLLPLVVIAITAIAFLPSLENGFVTWDDDGNFIQNPHYRGLGLTQLRWMWTTFHLGHYVPLSWMTLGLDYELWGMDARGYHLTSLVLHCINALLVYFVARRLVTAAVPDVATRNARALDFAAALGALFFSVHPLRVESVVWATERRDVLSGLFCSATALCYLRFVQAEESRSRSYVAAVLLFVCALLSKATSLTLPAVLLLLNIYPLRRLGGDAGWFSNSAKRVYREIVPFGVASLAIIPLTLVALAPPDQLHAIAKIAVSAYSLAFYFWKSIFPFGLSPLYPMPVAIDPTASRFLLSYLALIAIAGVAWRTRSTRPAIAIALAVFLIVVFPMLGIVQNGPQIAADRYTYHASPAFAVIVAAGLLTIFVRSPSIVPRFAAWSIIATFVGLTWIQSRVWHDPQTFWSYVVRADSSSAIAHSAIGTLDLKANHVDEALAEFRRAVGEDSTYGEAHANLGIALSRLGRFREAVPEYRVALAINPRNREAHNNLGVAASNLGLYDEAFAEFAEALELDPDYADAQTNWGNALVRNGKPNEAIAHYREALRIQPTNADAQHNWGVALAQEGQIEDAIAHFKAALAIDPSRPETNAYLERALALQRDI